MTSRTQKRSMIRLLNNQMPTQFNKCLNFSRSELINEYLQMEQRIDALEKRLARFRGGKSQEGDSAPSTPPLINQEISSKILAFQSEIRRLEQVKKSLKIHSFLDVGCFHR